MKVFAPTNKGLGHLALLVPSRSSFCFKFCMFFTKVSQSMTSYYGVSKWRLFICQSTCGLCRTNQDNPMMTRFLGDEMTLKTTLLVWEPMVTSNGLVSCVTSLDERFQPSMTSIGSSDNKVPMNPTSAQLVGYQWRWNRMTKHTWLTKPRNFECVPSNLLGRLIHGSFGYVVFPKCILKRLKFNWFANEEQIHEMFDFHVQDS